MRAEVKNAVSKVLSGQKEVTVVILLRRVDRHAEREVLATLNEVMPELEGFLFGRLGKEPAIAEWWFMVNGKFIVSWLYSDGYMLWIRTQVVPDIFKPVEELRILKEAKDGFLPFSLISHNEKLLKEVQV